MKFLIAGFGSIGRRHFRNLLTLGERDILLYHTYHSSLPDDELGGFPIETDLRAALAHQPDAVIVSNPTALHLEVAIPAAQCGCHLLIEKPISHSMARIDELEQVVQQNDNQVLVGYQLRFHPGLKLVKKLLDEGAIGEPVSARAHWGEYLPDWHPWEDYRQGYSARSDLGGGVILTLSHPLDYLRWLLGEVDCLWAFAGRLGDLEIDVEDTAEIEILKVDNRKVREQQIAKLQRLRAERDEKAVQAALNALTEGARGNANLLDLAVKAARAIDIPVTGIDFIVRSPRAPHYAFIEANERPGLANHEPQPTAERFIDLLFPLSLPAAARQASA